MFFLTQREQFVVLMLLGIFLLGLGVKQWRSMTTLPPKDVPCLLKPTK